LALAGVRCACLFSSVRSRCFCAPVCTAPTRRAGCPLNRSSRWMGRLLRPGWPQSPAAH